MDIENNALPSRSDMDPRYMWRLEDLYEENSLWEADCGKVKDMLPKMDSFRGRLSEGSRVLLDCLKSGDELSAVLDKLFCYARMRRDEDNSVSLYQNMTDRIMTLATEVSARLSWITPELSAIPEETLASWLETDTELAVYSHFIADLLRRKKHVLSAREEEMLAMMSEIAHAPSDVFTMFNNADIRFPVIKDEAGMDVELTKGRYITFLESRDRRVRQEAFKSLYGSYEAMRNTLGSLYAAHLKKDKFHATIRKYDSSLEHALDSDNIATDVYNNLISAVNANLPLLHRYLRIRKKLLNVPELHMYDLYVPLIEQPSEKIPYEKAAGMVKEGLSPLGKAYQELLEEAFSKGWIDVYENRGKTSGAYSWGTWSAHPYILLNYQGTISDVFTLAHELGHAMHSWYTNSAQPYVYSEYKIFVAEVASTVNENLLMKDLLAKTDDRQKEAWLLNHYLEEFRGTVFRQTMFAEFEKIVHNEMWDGKPLNTESFSAIYTDLNRKYFGPDVVLDPEIGMEWARIPHFYRSFYVYKYATGFSAAASLARQILEKGDEAVNRYIEFLKSGGSDYPLELLKRAGVDLYSPKPVQDAMDTFSEILDRFERLV
jgi:oligoendopeptidase F